MQVRYTTYDQDFNILKSFKCWLDYSNIFILQNNKIIDYLQSQLEKDSKVVFASLSCELSGALIYFVSIDGLMAELNMSSIQKDSRLFKLLLSLIKEEDLAPATLNCSGELTSFPHISWFELNCGLKYDAENLYNSSVKADSDNLYLEDLNSEFKATYKLSDIKRISTVCSLLRGQDYLDTLFFHLYPCNNITVFIVHLKSKWNNHENKNNLFRQIAE